MAARQVVVRAVQRQQQQQQQPWRRAAAASPMLAALAALRPPGLGPALLPRRGFQTLGSPLAAKKREYDGYVRNKRRADLADKGMLQTSTNNISVLLPDTMVRPPVVRYPRSPVKFVQMAWYCLRHTAMTYMTLAFYKLSSKPSFLGRAQFHIKRGALVPTAKALQLEMNDALARGDKDHLRRICTNEFYAKLASIIDARPKGYRAEWELVKYNRALTYPRIAEHKIGVMPMQPTGQRTIRQAVVSIASTQKVTRYDAAGAVTAAQTKSMVENLVLTCEIDEKTYESTPWKIWGTLPETTLKAHREAKALEEWMTKNAPPPRG